MTKIIGPEIVIIEKGKVVQGVPAHPEGSTKHPWKEKVVEVPAFGISKYPVTVEEYRRFGQLSGYPISDELQTDSRFQEDPRQPAVFVSWIDAVYYTFWLSRETGKNYRLPSDAEFEKASRGGLEGKRFPWGDDEPPGNCDCANPQGSPRPVGSFAPNGYGLYDMSGCVWEWCADRYDELAADKAVNQYDDTLVRDLRQNPICRGGSFKTGKPSQLSCAYRHEDPIDGRFDCIGFRVAQSV